MPTDATLPGVPPGLMVRLREGTADLHALAEGHRFQTTLVRGTTAMPDYVRWLVQMLAIHEALESALNSELTRHPEWAPLLRVELLQAERLRVDLRSHGVAAESVGVLPAAAGFREWIASTRERNPIALLGVLYVLEGSKNGNRFIARALRGRADGGAAGTSYLDPHGDLQRPLWLAFKREMDALSIAPSDADAILAAARETFEAVRRISDDLTS